MSAATPTKRRALGALDANVSTRSPSSSSTAAVKLAGSSPLKQPVAGTRHALPRGTVTPAKKRAPEGGASASPAFKKLCAATKVSPVKAAAKPKGGVEEEDSPPVSARQSLSPDASSLFDNSTINTSQLTTITELDGSAPTTTAATAVPLHVSATRAAASAARLDDLSALPPPRPRRVPPTREDLRKKAEILKLRLSLASYKVKTNQTDVPLDKLQVRPVPGMAPRHGAPSLLPSMSAHTVERATAAQYWYRSLGASQPGSASEAEGQDGASSSLLPKAVEGLVTPPRKSRGDEGEEAEEVRLSSSGLRGGAAKGLLSLSQASL